MHSIDDNYSDELLSAIFAGMCADKDDIVYFNTSSLDVLQYVNGYLNSMIGDLAQNKRLLAHKIMSDAPNDIIDDNKYIQLDGVSISTFLNEYKVKTKGKEPFFSFAEDFQKEVTKHNISLNSKFDFYFSDLFTELFSDKYKNGVQELRQSYSDFFEGTCRTLALNWIKDNT